MRRGRPVYSRVRQNMVDILYYLKQGYGYEIHKIYIKIFDTITRESVYYHLKKGVSLEEFKLTDSKHEKGEFSWGDTVQKHYYTLGPSAKPTMNKKVKKFLEKN